MAPEAARYVVVGAGGIGSWLVRALAPFLYSVEPGSTIAIVDGDVFEEANRARMVFGGIGPKAKVLAGELARLYGSRINLVPVPRYLNTRNASGLIGEGDVVFCQPDNHATRRLVERRCMRLREVALFSGGNDDASDPSEGTFGNVQVYLRANGEDATNPLSTFHPEIARPADQVPNAAGCGAQFPSAPQLLFTNLSVAAAMLGAFYAWRCGRLEHEEAYLDIVTGTVVPVIRELAAENTAPARRRR
jgi:hypothetical protein